MQLDARQTLMVSIWVLYLGKYLNHKIGFLRHYNIPEPVSGGVLASLVFAVIFGLFSVQIDFSLGLRDALLVIFFTTIGLSSNLKTLIQGGKPLVILLVAALFYLLFQNLIGVGVASLLGLNPLLGLISGSISLSGGHGTIIAWASVFVDNYGIENASEIGIACATFGLVLGGMIGGPIAQFLVNRYQLESTSDATLTVGVQFDERDKMIDYDMMLNCILALALSIGLGLELNDLFTVFGVKLPLFVTCLFAGIILTNTLPYIFRRYRWPANTRSMALISDLCLGLFLSMSLMSLQLWTLVGVGGTILVILLAQLIGIVLYSTVLVFQLMGRDYDAAVMASGYAGLALGATPTAIANMTAVTESFGPSPKSFITVPLIGAFFIDIANAFIIQRMLGWLS